jgi:hypothetical protein
MLLTHSLKRLTSYVKPPRNPVHTGTSKEWSAVEQKLGLTFPADFRELVETYGYGAFGEYIPFNPFVNSDVPGETELEFQIRMYQDNMERVIKRSGTSYILSDKNRLFETQVSTWPKRPGLFPIARDASSVLRAYHTLHGDSNRWTVAESEVHEHYFFDTNLTLVEYLIKMIEDPAIPGRFYDDGIYAEKYHKAKYYPFIRDGSEWRIPEIA